MGHKVVVFDISVVRALWETRVKKHKAWQKKEAERLEKSALEKYVFSVLACGFSGTRGLGRQHSGGGCLSSGISQAVTLAHGTSELSRCCLASERSIPVTVTPSVVRTHIPSRRGTGHQDATGNLVEGCQAGLTRPSDALHTWAAPVTMPRGSSRPPPFMHFSPHLLN